MLSKLKETLSQQEQGKPSLPNILTILTLVATAALSCCYLTIAINPRLPFNPFPPATHAALATVPPTSTNVPTPTPTEIPTATPTPEPTPTPIAGAYWTTEKIVSSYPLEKIEVAGTYEEIGQAFGEWYQEQRFSPRPLTADEQETAHAMLDLYTEVHTGTVEQMRGIYAAYDLNLDDVSEGIPVWDDWWSFLLPGVVYNPFCSVAFARPEMTADGHARLGRNNDWNSSMPQTTLVFAYPEDAYPNVVMTVGAPNFTAFDGMNDQGLALGVAAVDAAGYPTGTHPALIDLQVYHILLETCADVEEAISLLQEIPFAFSPQFGTHVLLADRSGASAVVEFLAEGVVVSRADTAYQVMTNSHWAGPADQPDCPRYQTAVGALEDGDGQIDTEEMMEVMAAVHTSTQWTIVYDLQDLTLTLSLPTDNFADRYEFSLADFVSRIKTLRVF
ncbi:MAG: hypothetical protein DRJ03_16075 [Chloroflexi bacterium]|nr:MAG: hypothetical protein DRI81_05065 [Chloroflexota bacterium]RLC83805.1 MAG: hypothetical protein DRJ03_16075 [Chloroflexota bacterium]